MVCDPGLLATASIGDGLLSAPVNILLIEDSPADAGLLRAALNEVPEQTFRLSRVETLNDGLKRLCESSFDVLLLDLSLPDSLGLSSLERINDVAAQLPVVVLTGLDDEKIAAQAIDRGAQDYLVKGHQDGRTIARSIRYAISRKHTALQLEKAKADAEAANIAKSRFLANISHELRTPMNAILGMTELALDESVSSAVREQLSTVKTAGEDLLALLNEILDCAKVESGKIEIETVRFDLFSVLEDVGKALGVRAFQKDIELIFDVEPSVPFRIYGDPLRVKQVLVNLLGNAIKFTDQGHVVLHVSCAHRSVADVVLQFDIQDTGPGLSPEQLRTVFEPFTQGDSSTTRKHGGTGLGLTIASNLTRLMGGQIWVDSVVGLGSTFSFTVVFTIDEERASETPDPHRAVAGIRVLLVEDQLLCRQIIGRELEQRSIQTDIVIDGASCLERLQLLNPAKDDYDLIIVDDSVRVGTESLALHIKQTGLYKGPMVVLASPAKLTPACIRKAAEANISIVRKPFLGRQLAGGVAECLHPVSSIPMKSGASRIRSIEGRMRSLRVLLAEDTALNQKLIAAIMKKRGHSIDIVENGADAVEAVASRNYDVVLMDVQMPEMDGYQATAQIRTLPDPAKSQIPIIAMTAHAMVGDREQCIAAGMNSYVSKPIQIYDLIDLVEKLGNASCEDRLQENVEADSSKSPDLKSPSDTVSDRF